MKIIEFPISKLVPHADNPRHNEDAVPGVAESIKQFGFKVPIVIDGHNEIVAGHTRFEAAKKLGLETVPVIVADDLTDEQVEAFRLADNKTAELAGWDYQLLSQELAEIHSINMSDFGFELERDDFDLDSFFDDDDEQKDEQEPKRVKCPCCGEWVEVE